MSAVSPKAEKAARNKKDGVQKSVGRSRSISPRPAHLERSLRARISGDGVSRHAVLPHQANQMPFRQRGSLSGLTSTVREPSSFNGCSQAHATDLSTPGRISSFAEGLIAPV